MPAIPRLAKRLRSRVKTTQSWSDVEDSKGAPDSELQLQGAMQNLPQRQYIFLVRHAQSRWNAAQMGTRIVDMYKENDHGISELGREQAEALRRAILGSMCEDSAFDTWTQHFWNVGAIFTSPLTRSVQTAIISLRDVIASGKHELLLMKAARERRSIGGADASGVATGGAIKARVKRELDHLYHANVRWETAGGSPQTSGCSSVRTEDDVRTGFTGLRRTKSSEVQLQQRASLLQAFDLVELNTGDVQEKWWNDFPETTTDFRQRLATFMAQIRASGEGNVIVVGHSVFFSSLLRTLGCSGGDSSDSVCDMAALLGRQKLPNCGVVGLQVDWSTGSPVLEDICPLFGTDLDTNPSPVKIAKGDAVGASWVGSIKRRLKSSNSVCAL